MKKKIYVCDVLMFPASVILPQRLSLSSRDLSLGSIYQSYILLHIVTVIKCQVVAGAGQGLSKLRNEDMLFILSIWVMIKPENGGKPSPVEQHISSKQCAMTRHRWKQSLE